LLIFVRKFNTLIIKRFYHNQQSFYIKKSFQNFFTGQLQNFDIEPDILVLGKGLGGGVIPQEDVHAKGGER